MVEFKGRYIGMAKSLTNNRIELYLEVAEPDKAKTIDSELAGKGDLTIEIKKYRKKRSLDANAYFWALVDKLSVKTGQDRIQIYRNAIKDIGGVSEIICLKSEAANKLCEVWSEKGIGWQADVMPSKLRGCKNVILYYGSSTYNTEQMSRLIDNIVQDCKAVGIETMTPAELAVLKEAWGKGKNNEHNSFNGKARKKSRA